MAGYPGRFDGFNAVPASVSKTYLVRFDNNRYSVAAGAVGRPVEIRAYAERIEIRQDGRVVGEHPAGSGATGRSAIRGTTSWSSADYLSRMDFIIIFDELGYAARAA